MRKLIYVLLWLISIILLGASFLTIIIWTKEDESSYFAASMLMLVLSFALYIFSHKKIIYNEKYNLPQIALFYILCSLMKFTKKSKKKSMMLIAQKFKFSEKLDEKEVLLLYKEGKQLFSRKH